MLKIIYAKPAGNKVPLIRTDKLEEYMQPEFVGVCVSSKSKAYTIESKEVKDSLEEQIKRRQLRKKHKNYILGGTFDGA